MDEYYVFIKICSWNLYLNWNWRNIFRKYEFINLVDAFAAIHREREKKKSFEQRKKPNSETCNQIHVDVVLQRVYAMSDTLQMIFYIDIAIKWLCTDSWLSDTIWLSQIRCSLSFWAEQKQSVCIHIFLDFHSSCFDAIHWIALKTTAETKTNNQTNPRNIQYGLGHDLDNRWPAQMHMISICNSIFVDIQRQYRKEKKWQELMTISNESNNCFFYSQRQYKTQVNCMDGVRRSWSSCCCNNATIYCRKTRDELFQRSGTLDRQKSLFTFFYVQICWVAPLFWLLQAACSIVA